MDEWIKRREIIVVDSTLCMNPVGLDANEAAEKLTSIIGELSRNAGVPKSEFYRWLSQAKGQMGGIALYEGKYHHDANRKLHLMLAFLDRDQYHMFLGENTPTPSIVDTRLCPFFLRKLEADARMQRAPEMHFDAYFGGEIVLLKETGHLFQDLISERQEVFSANALEVLYELITHRVFFELCRKKGYLNREHEHNSSIRSLMIKCADEKLAAIARMIHDDKRMEDKLTSTTTLQLQSLRVERDMAMSVVKKMTRRMKDHSPLMPRSKFTAAISFRRQVR